MSITTMKKEIYGLLEGESSCSKMTNCMSTKAKFKKGKQQDRMYIVFFILMIITFITFEYIIFPIIIKFEMVQRKHQLGIDKQTEWFKKYNEYLVGLFFMSMFLNVVLCQLDPGRLKGPFSKVLDQEIESMQPNIEEVRLERTSVSEKLKQIKVDRYIQILREKDNS